MRPATTRAEDRSITPDEFITKSPLLYHMAEEGSWQRILRHGLLSTSALLDLYAYSGPARVAIESMRRPASVSITHPVYGVAAIRDNKPMTERGLKRCLVGMTPRQWFELLNRRCFFWCQRERLDVMLHAAAYRGQRKVVLTLDSAAMLARHADEIELSAINTGATLYFPRPRGRESFRRLAAFPSNARPVELVVPYAVPDIAELVVDVEYTQSEAAAPDEVWG
jgi:hypothetical protein